MTGSTWDPLRRALWPLSFVYRSVTGLRNRCYDAGILKQHSLDVPVVSVGNLTVGGTGKTPLVAWLVGLARREGRRPGVLARGYGREPGAALNDEGQLLAARFAGLPQVQDPDRVRGGRRLVAEHDVDLVILDDGLQHRRLARDLDIVCVDALRPFAQGAVLPAGDLRETARGGLRRAGLVVMTRADRLGGPLDVSARKRQLVEFAQRDLPVYACRHSATALVSLDGGETNSLEALRGRRVVLVAAIARPESFARTVEELGGAVVERHWFRDHHRYTARDAARLGARAGELGAELVTTEKDAVKLAMFGIDATVLRIDLEWIGQAPPADEVLVA